MKIARYRLHDAIHHGVLEGERLQRLAGSPFDSLTPSGQTDALADATLLCPLAAPRIFAVGMNYRGHIAEAGAKTPDIPQFFMMPATAAIGPGETRQIRLRMSSKIFSGERIVPVNAPQQFVAGLLRFDKADGGQQMVLLRSNIIPARYGTVAIGN